MKRGRICWRQCRQILPHLHWFSVVSISVQDTGILIPVLHFQFYTRPGLAKREVVNEIYIKKGSARLQDAPLFYTGLEELRNYIMPPIPPIPPAGMAGAGFSSFLSAITHSVVRNIPAIEAAFSRATRVTLAGSITPAAKKFS